MASKLALDDNRSVENIEKSTKPRRILLFSGKRKCGKDFITNILHERIGPERSTIIKLSGPIKNHWAKSLGLDVDKLLGDGEYKEKYRLDMVKWGESMRKKDIGFFCRLALEMYNAHKNPDVWIISDVRRKTDIQWFAQIFGVACKTINIVCNDTVRAKRGWSFVPGIDDSETECDLDDIGTWDLEIENNCESVEHILEQILEII